MADDPGAARRKAAAASEHIRNHFTWEHTTDAVERRLQALDEMRNWPQINTDEHRWESWKQVLPAGASAGTSQAEASECLSDLCSSVSICGSSLSAPKAKVYNFRKAVVHRMAGQPAEAKGTWRRILTLKRPEQFCSVDQGIYGHLTLRRPRRAGPGAWRPWRSTAPLEIDPGGMPR